MTQRILSLALAALTLGVSPLAFAADDVLSVAGKKPELSTFVRLVQQAGLSSAVNAAGVTVFAPTDEAFKAVPADTLDKLAKDPEQLKAVLSYHVLPSKLQSSAIDGSTSIATLNGAKVNVSKAGDMVVVDDSLVTVADIAADNGVIHEIDRVLLPAVKK
ncbi:MAG: fasciclin domain-containing protein [Rubrivivax sp.]|nr:MAG: fasciclin domain-containing protein [Rubrivivax sp.]